MTDQPRLDGIDRRSIIAGVGAGAVGGLAGCLGQPNGDVVRLDAGGTGGTYYPLAGEFETIIEDETEYDVQVSSTGASVENVGNLGSENSDLALVQNDVAYFAFTGTGLEDFEENPIENLRGVATLYPETIHVVSRPEAGIETLADLRGQRVNTGDLGSGTQVNALQILESIGGLTPQDFDEQNTDFSQAADQLRDGNIEAAFVVGGWPVGAVEELATTTEIDIVGIPQEDREAIMQEAEFYSEDTIPGGTYGGLAEDVETISVQAMIATREGYDADIVETLTAAMFDNADRVTIKAQYIDRESALEGMSIDLHEGAARYFDE